MHHQDYNHTIEDYHNFKFMIEMKEKKGDIDEFVQGKGKHLVITLDKRINLTISGVYKISKTQ